MLPVYVFDCPLALLVDSYINNFDVTSSLNKDVYEDHRYKFGVFTQEDCIKYKYGLLYFLYLIQFTFRGKAEDAQSDSPEPKSDDSDLDQCNTARQHCKALVLAHSKCFAMSLFSALHYGAFVHSSDVQSAMDQCEETIYEIDITNYIQVSLILDLISYLN